MDIIEAICTDEKGGNILDITSKLKNGITNNILFISKNIKLDFISSSHRIIKIIWKINNNKILYQENIINNRLKNEIALGTKVSSEIFLNNLYSYKRLVHYFSIDSILISNKKSSIDITKKIIDYSSSSKYYFYLSNKLNILDFCDITSNNTNMNIIYNEYSIFETIFYIKNNYLKKDLVLGINYNDYKINLITHIVPRKCSMLNINLNYISNNIKLFNNHKIVSIASDENLESTDYLKKWFNLSDISILNKINNPKLGESISFKNLLELVQSENPKEFTFYCHSKGISQANDNNSCIAVWIELMYKYCLANLDIMILSGKPFGGAIRSFNLFPKGISPAWHYTGTFYWFNHTIFKIPNLYNFVIDDYYNTEMFPGFLVKAENSIYFLKDKADPFYECFLDKNLQCILDNYELFESDLAKSIKNIINKIITINLD